MKVFLHRLILHNVFQKTTKEQSWTTTKRTPQKLFYSKQFIAQCLSCVRSCDLVFLPSLKGIYYVFPFFQLYINNVTMLDIHIKCVQSFKIMRQTYIEVNPMSKKHQLQTAQFPALLLLSAQANVSL